MNMDVHFLFAADLDGTLLPNTGKTPAPGCLERTQNLLNSLRARGVPICFVTGRHLSLAKKALPRSACRHLTGGYAMLAQKSITRQENRTKTGKNS